MDKYNPIFKIHEFKVSISEPTHHDSNSKATVRISVDGDEEASAAAGDGPVNALDIALRKALSAFYPAIFKIKLTDYKVRVLDSTRATASTVRVIIESTDGQNVWSTIGVSSDVIEASWQALIDSYEYYLLMINRRK